MTIVPRSLQRKGFLTLSALALSVLVASCERPASSGNVQQSPANAKKTTTSDAPFTLKVQTDRSTIFSRGKQSVYLLVTMNVPAKENDGTPRPPLNVGMVIDRSGSMAEKNKIDYARASASQLIDSLSDKDLLAIVEYDDAVSVLAPSAPVTDKVRLKRLVNDLEPRGSTNLCGGLMHGVTQVKNAAREDRTNRVVLLTDGLANRGITDHQRIASLVRNWRRQGITVSAMGLGLDYDENLLQLIAECGGGNYYYIESPQQMASIFSQELRTLAGTVANGVRLTFRGEQAVDSVITYGYESVINRATAEIALPSLYKGEKRAVVLRLVLTPGESVDLNAGRIEIAYTESGTGTPSVITVPVSLSCSGNMKTVNASRKPEVLAEALLIEADENHEKYVALYEQGHTAQAKSHITALASSIRNANRSLNDKKLSKKLEALQLESRDMDRADRNIQDKKAYLKTNKQRLLYGKKGKRGKYLLQPGDLNPEVVALQKKLQDRQLYSGPINGEYSSEVERAIRSYQRSNSLDADGIAGPATLRSLQLY